MIVVGTAGHIDHGKSSIVRRLTGTDPDRLPEEKARGMTIDLGFAFYTTPDGEDIAFIDVPGHERFVKNMISGTGGIDVAMLVVAADDGWMPQSQEHFQVVRLLGIRDAIIVINKIDLVQRDWIELIKQDIKTKVARSIFEGAPILVVSAETGEGFEALGEHLNVLPQKVRGHADVGKARLYIDRAFVRPGMGGVVTGTLRGGRLSVGQQVSVWPTMTVGKVRTLQSMNRDVTTAIPGQRTAVSFTGIDKDVLQRGGVVSDRLDLSFFRSHKVLALALELIPEAAVSLTNRRRILLMVGTTEVEGEIRLPAGREMRPGESGVVFFKPEEPIYCLVGDHFIARLPTPMVTLGGGT
ncbi:MAG TPA: selenocysteine-specific translation elongation factor, partial [Candidatus Deferrimicrobium sp.]|nr:selenocysteine-specific translation elongation factor [Candidatus Deferrimicrobium sp.]